MSLNQYLPCLTTEHLKQLNSDLIESGIAFSLGGDYKTIFKQRRAESKGKRKKIYAALCHASQSECSRMADRMSECLPIVQQLKKDYDERNITNM
jgi:hypothetical protein